jgi:hypothetical protein
MTTDKPNGAACIVLLKDKGCMVRRRKRQEKKEGKGAACARGVENNKGSAAVRGGLFSVDVGGKKKEEK